MTDIVIGYKDGKEIWRGELMTAADGHGYARTFEYAGDTKIMVNRFLSRLPSGEEFKIFEENNEK